MESRTSLLLIVLLIAITQQQQTVVGQQGGEGGDCVVSISLQADGIVPDVVDRAPCRLIQVTYDNNVEVNLGNELTPTQVRDSPEVNWISNSLKYYTLVMVDPDVPSRRLPLLREFKHWIVVNIPGNKVDEGETLAEYVGSAPSRGSGLHRYVFLVYEQPRKMPFLGEPRTSNTSIRDRPRFSVQQFAQRNNLSDPLAANYYQAQFDDSVPELQRKLLLGLLPGFLSDCNPGQFFRRFTTQRILPFLC